MGLIWTVFIIICLLLAGKFMFHEDDWRNRH